MEAHTPDDAIDDADAILDLLEAILRLDRAKWQLRTAGLAMGAPWNHVRDELARATEALDRLRPPGWADPRDQRRHR